MVKIEEKFKTTVINAFNLSDAWFQVIDQLLKHGHTWKIERGSFVGHFRREFDFVVIDISNPFDRPLSPEVPEGVPQPASDAEINGYLQILLTPEKGDYSYNYGERIDIQTEEIVKILTKTPMTNQATIEVGRPEDVFMEHPPCLRVIDFRVRYGALHMFVYFRSWDAYAGFPMNLGGLQLFSEHIAKRCGLKYGHMVVASKGLHIYDTQWKFAKLLIAGGKNESEKNEVNTL